MDFQRLNQRLKQLLFFKHKMNSITELLFCNKQHFHFEDPSYNQRYFVFQIDNKLLSESLAGPPKIGSVIHEPKSLV